MGRTVGPLRDCGNCGRTFNKHINDHCPACGTDSRGQDCHSNTREEA